MKLKMQHKNYVLFAAFLVFFIGDIVDGASLANDDYGNYKNDKAVTELHEGQLKVANAAWWGFDDKDSTNALQSAINSGAEKVIVPFMGYDWAVRPIYLASDQEIYFEPGVVIIAKKGQFKNNHDSVFRANNKKNITLSGYGAAIRMHKEDYRDPNNYEKGEWRMGIYLVSCSNIKVLGLTIADTGGDGIYLGENRNPAYNEDILIKDCVFDNNYRQGISIIGAKNFLVENCVFKNTSGTAPGDGIDFEPNNFVNKLTNCTIRNCTFENNEGCGVQICVTHLLHEKTEPISILVENCHIKSSKKMGFLIGTITDRTVAGTIRYENCTIENTGNAGLMMYDKPNGLLEISFINCKWKNPFLDNEEPLDLHVPMTSIVLKNQNPTGKGFTAFTNCYLIGTKKEQFFVPIELEKSHGIHTVNVN